jgi:serine/threonine protein kinase/DNA-binding response OmpR family regulator
MESKMKKNILLVEYSNSTVETIKELLSYPIFNITLADEGEAAKKLLKSKKFDLMITAAMLPKFHGFNLSQFAATNYPETKIIIISEVYKGMDYKYQATTQYKADDFFEKPLDLNKFKERILKLLEINESDLKESQPSAPPKTSVSDTKKIPTFKKMEENEKTLTSEDIFGDIIDEVQKSSPYEIKLDGEDGNLPKKEEGKKNAEDNAAKPSESSAQEDKPDKDLVSTQELPTQKSKEKVKPEAFDFTPITLSKTLDQLKDDKKVEKKPEDKFRKLEDDISKKFEQTLSGLGLDAKKHGLKDPKQKRPEVIQKQKPPETKVKEVRQEEVGGYDILGLIARGGMAEIYKAKKKGVKGFEKIIALKKILSGYGKDDKYIEMFVDEAKISAELSHPNIVQIYDLGRKDDYYFIAMEYVSGKDLRLILRKLEITESLLPEEISIYLILKVLEALNYAHSAKNSGGKNLDIVHRDISPPNILVSFDGEVKLTDFGVSKASIKLHQTVAGALKGKLLYMSPEQASGDQDIDYRSDLYSVGIILFELITGKKLFINPSEMAVLKKVQSGEIIKPSKIKKDINPVIEDIILKLLKKEKEERYQKAADVIKDLETYISKHFSHMPGPSHMSHTIYNLFKEEITRDGIKIELKPIPYEISKLRVDEKQASIEPEKKKIEEPDIEELKEEDIIIEDNEIEELDAPKADIDKPEKKETILPPATEPISAPEPVAGETEIEHEEVDQDYGTTFEITFDEDKKEKPDTIPVPEAELVEPGIKSIDEEFKKSKKPLIFSLVAIFVIASFIVVYLFVIGKKPMAQDNPEALVQKPAVVTKDELPKSTPKETTTSETGKDTMETALKKKEVKPAVDDAETMLSEFTPPGRTYLERKISKESEEEKPEEKPIEKKQVDTQPDEKKQETQAATQVKEPPKEEPASTEKKEEPPKPEEKTDKPVEKEGETKETEEKTEEQGDQLSEEEQLKQKELEEQKQKALLLEQEKEAERKRLEAEAEKNQIKEGQTVVINDVDTPPVPISEPGVKLKGILRNMITQPQNISANYLIDHNGNVERVFLLRKSRFKKLNELVEKTLLGWKYKPALKNNVKVKVWKTISFKITK